MRMEQQHYGERYPQRDGDEEAEGRCLRGCKCCTREGCRESCANCCTRESCAEYMRKLGSCLYGFFCCTYNPYSFGKTIAIIPFWPVVGMLLLTGGMIALLFGIGAVSNSSSGTETDDNFIQAPPTGLVWPYTHPHRYHPHHRFPPHRHSPSRPHPNSSARLPCKCIHYAPHPTLRPPHLDTTPPSTSSASLTPRSNPVASSSTTTFASSLEVRLASFFCSICSSHV